MTYSYMYVTRWSLCYVSLLVCFCCFVFVGVTVHGLSLMWTIGCVPDRFITAFPPQTSLQHTSQLTISDLILKPVEYLWHQFQKPNYDIYDVHGCECWVRDWYW